MILYPAIDLKDGQCVRLLRGDMNAATVFGSDPAAQALVFESAGCQWLHLVDLNGAFAGTPVNAAAVEAVLKAVSVPVQLGGGIRDISTIADWLDVGISRVILGTVADEDPDLVRRAAKAFPDKIAVGIDARKGLVATRGWAEETNIQATDLAKAFEDAGFHGIEIVERSNAPWQTVKGIELSAQIRGNEPEISDTTGFGSGVVRALSA